MQNSSVSSFPLVVVVVSSPGSPQELVSLVLVHAIQENILLLKMFSSYDAAEFLRREIQQYCNKPGADHFNGPITPQSRPFPIHILGVPSTLGEDTYNRIVTLWPWKCSCIDNDLNFFVLIEYISTPNLSLHHCWRQLKLRREECYCTLDINCALFHALQQTKKLNQLPNHMYRVSGQNSPAEQRNASTKLFQTTVKTMHGFLPFFPPFIQMTILNK